MNKRPSIPWNDKIRLALSDVDETVTEVYTPAETEMIAQLTRFLREGRKLFLVTGGSLRRVLKDITELIPAELRHDILISHCSGAEVWGFTAGGYLQPKPFYSIYEDTFTDAMKKSWRTIVDQLIKEFGLRPHPVQSKIEFWEMIGRDPLDIMLDDRGPQITLEAVNGIDLSGDDLEKLPYGVPLTRGKYDLRVAVQNRARTLFTKHHIPIEPRLGGVFALDFAIASASKTTSIHKVLVDDTVLQTIGLSTKDVQAIDELEVWGDKFSVVNSGTDYQMSKALPPKVRSIDFREEDPSELPKGYNIVLWNGEHHLHHGLLEYLSSR